MTDILITDPSRRITAKDAVIDTFEATFDFGTVASNSKTGYILTVTPEFGGLIIVNHSADLMVDTDALTHKYPNGSSLTAAQRDVDFFQNADAGFYVDDWTTDDSVGRRAFVFEIVNYDASSHNYFLKIKLYGLFFAGSVA